MRSAVNSVLKTLPIVTIAASVSLLITTSFKLFLPYSYLILLCIYAIIASLTIVLLGRNYYELRGRTIIVASVIIFALLLRSLYMLRTDLSIEPLYDGYKDIVVSYLFFKHKHAYIVSESYPLAYASSFPTLNILTALVADVLGIKVLKSAIFLSLTTGLCIYLAVILFAKYFMTSLRLRCYFIILVLVLGSIWPELIYYSMVYYPRHFCLALYCLLIYLIFVSKYLPIAAILAIALPLSYGYYPALIIIALMIFTMSNILLTSVAKLKRIPIWGSTNLSLLKSRIKFIVIIVVFLLIGELAVLTYYIAQPVLKSCKSILDKVLSFWFREPTIKKQLYAPYWIPPILNNPWNVLVKIRDLVIYPSAIASFLILLFSLIRSILRRDFNTQFMFKLDLLLVITVYVIVWIVFVGVIQTLINLIIYLLIPLSALTYYYLFNNAVATRYGTVVIVLLTVLFTMLIVIGGLSLWSHRVLLKHYYDPSISLVEAGDHNPLYVHVNYFLKGYLVLHKIREIYTDDLAIASYMFQPLNPSIAIRPCYNTITVDEFLHSSKSVLVLLLDRYLPLGPYGWEPLNITSLYLEKAKIISTLNRQSNLIYSLRAMLPGERIKVYIPAR